MSWGGGWCGGTAAAGSITRGACTGTWCAGTTAAGGCSAGTIGGALFTVEPWIAGWLVASIVIVSIGP